MLLISDYDHDDRKVMALSIVLVTSSFAQYSLLFGIVGFLCSTALFSIFDQTLFQTVFMHFASDYVQFTFDRLKNY